MKNIKNKSLLIILFSYLFLTIILKTSYSNFYFNICNFFISLILLIILIIYQKKNYIRINHSKVLTYTVIIAIIYQIVYFYLGFLFGFQESPYNHTLLRILENILTQIFPIITLELFRGFLISSNKKNQFLLVLVTIICILLEVNYTSLFKISTTEELFKYICAKIIPLIANNILYTYLSLNYSYHLPLVFQILNRLTYLLLPIIPSLDWFMTGTIGIVSTTLIYVLFKYKITKEKKVKSKKQKTSFVIISYAFTLLFATFLIFFMTGLLKYEPIAILSNSMIPTFSRGDMLVFKKLNEKELANLKVGEVIVYKNEKRHIAHRIVKVVKNFDTVSYITKGDNNLTNDNLLVQTKDIEGVVKFYIKYLGYPSVYLNDYFQNGG